MLETEPIPQPQSGTAVVFKRRTPDQSEIPAKSSLLSLHDFIRMLDAEGYPRAFIEHKGFRYEFSRASMRDGRLEADVKIAPVKGVEP